MEIEIFFIHLVDDYYPQGGMDDVRYKSSDKEEALAMFNAMEFKSNQYLILTYVSLTEDGEVIQRDHNKISGETFHDYDL